MLILSTLGGCPQGLTFALSFRDNMLCSALLPAHGETDNIFCCKPASYLSRQARLPVAYTSTCTVLVVVMPASVRGWPYARRTLYEHYSKNADQYAWDEMTCHTRRRGVHSL